MSVDDLDDLLAYDYSLPVHCIARHPAERRDQARLLVLDRSRQAWRDGVISQLPDLLRAGDCLVLNDTRVLPARLMGHRAATSGKWEGLFLEATSDGQWRLIGQTRGRLTPGETILVQSVHHASDLAPLELRLAVQDEDGVWTASCSSNLPAEVILQQYGTVPLPPYIERPIAEADDWNRYQTTYAIRPGSVAAPTAGLHFTPELLARCQEAGIEIARVTLHVGIGTFKPISVARLDDHKMHSEWCEVSSSTVQHLQSIRRRGGRIIAVGTTSVRTLESASQSGELQPWCGRTNLFIRPGYSFRSVDGMLTNFHLPKSTLLVLVSAFAGIPLIRAAYQHAIESGYRFYSYGDAMLIC